ncbi:hypothetical protein I4U23_012873 [Adineta vaga]|nr:hypothetical protein I4U23_012873 [Adineta vaga]
MKLSFIIIICSLFAIESLCRSSTHSSKSECPTGVQKVACFVDPCFMKTCQTDSTLKCISDYCDGCNAKWMKPNGETTQCPPKKKSRCPFGQKEVQCFKDPCQGETCPRDPSAKCISNYCGGCNFSWKKSNGKKARC